MTTPVTAFRNENIPARSQVHANANETFDRREVRKGKRQLVRFPPNPAGNPAGAYFGVARGATCRTAKLLKLEIPTPEGRDETQPMRSRAVVAGECE